MSRLLRLMIVSVIAAIAGSGLAGDAVPDAARGPWLLSLPPVPAAEAAEFDWQAIFPNGDLDDGPYAPNPPPTNHTFSSGLSSWEYYGDVTSQSGGPTGNYARLEGATLISPGIEVEYTAGTHVLSYDVGFLEANINGLACIVVTGITESEDEISLGFLCESEGLPFWRTEVRELGDLPPGDPIVAIRFESSGVIGLDNVAEQYVPVPGWYVSPSSGAVPTIEEGGPEGHYLHLPPGASASIAAEWPEGAKSLVYWRRVPEGSADTLIYVSANNGEAGEDEDWVELAAFSNDAALPDTWVKRVIDISACPPENLNEEFDGDCELLYVSIYNDGEEDLDFVFSTSTDTDADEDGIYDDWEEYGVLTRGTAWQEIEEQWQWVSIYNWIDLPAMGADPEKPDIFVHLDYMLDELHNQRLEDDAIETIVDAFADSPYVSPTESVGINLHVDQGPDSILDFSTDAEWDDLSSAGPIEFYEVIGEISNNTYDWDDFDDRKQERFLPTGRTPIFHYAIAAYWLDEDANEKGTSGWARVTGTDFVISLGSYPSGHGTVEQQAGTFMHELGHNLGLLHGGHEPTNHKPNYLSVMNYSFQFIGLIEGGEAGHFDYSRVDLDNLYESSLDESLGLGEEAEGYGTVYFCGTEDEDMAPPFLGDGSTESIDWNCNEEVDEPGLIVSINKNASLETLEGNNDWTSLIFVGGAIGGPGYGPAWNEKESRLIQAGEHAEIDFKTAERRGLLDFDSLRRKAEAGKIKRKAQGR